MKSHYTRRHRRSSRMVLRSHGKFKINHCAPFGRTGSKRGPQKAKNFKKIRKKFLKVVLLEQIMNPKSAN